MPRCCTTPDNHNEGWICWKRPRASIPCTRQTIPFTRDRRCLSWGDTPKPVDEFRFGLNQNPTSQRLRVWLAATYAQMDLAEEARWEAEEILANDPDFDPARLESIFPFQSDSDLQRFNRALDKAGFNQLPVRG